MNKNINILIVEDDTDINKLLCKILEKNNYNVRGAFSGTEAEMCIEKYDFQLVLLDLMLPGITGEKLIEKIRKIKTMPVIVISAKTAQETKIQVLKLGADDFISKPFDVEEVLARVCAQLRRYMIFSNSNEKQNILTYKNMTLDRENHKVFINSQEVILTIREFCILELLMSYPKKVFTKANLFEHVWKDKFISDDNTINVHMSNLRSKIAKVDSNTEYIHTVWGIGFKMKD
ncbi:response regulator transcription factor [Clostridium autoethanogenum]|uniref:Stage 0 sporulation protein A homolog n=1 Tax=Clostridium autoethanogenum DSM 10061 TaxID=1341692 RepID=A0ABM5NWF6_9CLOT|nr:response regulator transcription factor [Clostridium autoethanogenum]AGY76740.1 response regulator transcription factor [Clostridium autoethanogenum DSM 10061]ALU36894.1 Two component transcriptional regulator winged helix family [Clostridium autoethanogenum DSM 10061]OVY50416.1 Sensory transduction protein regX3 [Clostridium autoethanogenum]